MSQHTPYLITHPESEKYWFRRRVPGHANQRLPLRHGRTMSEDLQYQVARARWRLKIPGHIALFLSLHPHRAWNETNSVGQHSSRDLPPTPPHPHHTTILKQPK